ncbi:MAG TPA: sulfotransferase [Acidimicrobiia bacterium]|nr:sulfotransferase [Acidimicrobiia bacterium]
MSAGPSRAPVYIGGLDRSGKTTMAGFLTSHPNIDIPAVGSNLWTYFYGRYGDLAEGDNFDRCLEALVHYKHVAFLQPDPARIRREFAQGAATYGRLFELVHVHHAERSGKPRYGDQTGLVERYADPLFRAYPDVRVIHMVRDPRDRYEASLARWPDGRGRAGGAAARWAYSMRLADRNARRHPGRYLVVRFEDLVTQTEQTLRDACAFIGEEFHPSMLQMPGAPMRRARLLAAPGATPGTLLTHDVIGAFRGRIDTDELAFLQLQLRRRLRAHGYELQPTGWAPSHWVRFLATTWPDQALRMASWRVRESLQQRLPTLVARRPHHRMVLPDVVGAS